MATAKGGSTTGLRERTRLRDDAEQLHQPNWFTDADERDVIRALRCGHIAGCEKPLYGSNSSYLMAVARSPRDRDVLCHAVYKPRRGEAPLWDFPDGTLFKREYATFIVSRALGWSFVPPTVIRDGPYGIGTVQLFVPVDPRERVQRSAQVHERDLMRLAIFDWLVNNADRKAAHCFVGIDGRIWAIDHGLTFHAQPKLRTVLQEFTGTTVPSWILRDLATLTIERKADPLRRSLSALIEPKELEVFFKRLDKVLRDRTFPSGRDYRYRSYDWW